MLSDKEIQQFFNCIMADRYGDEAERFAAEEKDAERKTELLKIGET